MNCQITRRGAFITLGVLIMITVIHMLGSYHGYSIIQAIRPNSTTIPHTITFYNIHEEESTLPSVISTKQQQILRPQNISDQDSSIAEPTKETYYVVSKSSTSSPIPLDPCPVIDIVMFVSGDIASRYIYPTIKSVLIHRSTKLHFHFITDVRAKTVLKSMLNTWLVPGISHDYYDLKLAQETVNILTNCLGTLPLKLNLHKILPDTVDSVIVLEPTAVLNIDPLDLWKLIMSCNNHPITLCSEQCLSYCHNDNILPSINSNDHAFLWGINLARMRSSPQVLTSTLQTIDQCAADKIYGALENAGILLDITGTGLSTASDTEQTCLKMLTIFNSHEYHEPKVVCKSVEDYDGNKLRYDTTRLCGNDTHTLLPTPPPEKNICDYFHFEGTTRRREIPFLMGHSYESTDEYDVTLINHVNYDRVHLIERSLTNWYGPVSLAIQVTESQLKGVVDVILNSKVLQERKNITYHLLFNIGPSYPINALREVAQKYASTPYVFDSDIDLIYSNDMHRTLKQDLRELGSIHKMALIIPCMETDSADFKVPDTKEEVVKLMNQDILRQVHVHSYYKGQGQTNYKKWKYATEPYHIEWKNMYEPYTLVETSVVPFDRRFVARFHDKGSRNIELHMNGFKFKVVHNVFSVHMPHPKNSQNMPHLQKCSKRWYTDWIHEKQKQYNYYKKDVPDSFKYKK